jgi:hypothetical protein
MQLWNRAIRDRNKELSPQQQRKLKDKFRVLVEKLPEKRTGKRHFGAARRKKLDAHYEAELAQIRSRWGAQMLDFSKPS